MVAVYDSAFYAGQSPGSYRSAQIVARLLLDALPIGSVCDVGCGVGTWLRAFLELGVPDVLGVDGPHVDVGLLQIPADRFKAQDLAAPLDLGRRFDLVASLEVAEHLPASAADVFVDSLVRHADIVLFSAATPGQGGVGHVNEQWQSYWAAKFDRRGYTAFDFVRPKVWRNPAVQWWYRQNALLYVSAAKADELAPLLGPPARELDLVHPAQVWASMRSPRRALRLAREAMRRG